MTDLTPQQNCFYHTSQFTAGPVVPIYTTRVVPGEGGRPIFGTFLDRADGQSLPHPHPRRDEVLGQSIALTLFWDFLPILELGARELGAGKCASIKGCTYIRGDRILMVDPSFRPEGGF